MPNSKITVFVADDHEIVAKGVSIILKTISFMIPRNLTTNVNKLRIENLILP